MSRAVVEQVHKEQPHLLRWNSASACTEFVQRVLLKLGADWGHVFKTGGQGIGEAGWVLPNGVKVSYDVIFSKSQHLQVDIITGGGGHPAPGGPGWHEIDRAVYRPSNVWTPQQPLFTSDAPAAGAVTPAKLGWGWFCLLRALKDWPSDARANFDYIERELNPDYYRVFMDLEGQDHARNGVDPWARAGINITAPDWEDDLKRALDFLGEKGKQAHCTMYGGRNHAPTIDARRRAHDRFVRVCSGRWQAIDGVEGVNEFNINRFAPEDVRLIVRDLAGKLPAGMGLACSSPALAHGLMEVGGAWHEATNEEMADSVDELYANVPATEMTIHHSRDPQSKWAAPFSYNPYLPALKKRNNEPRGPGASAGGDIADAAAIVGDYQRTSEAGWSHYTGHSRWSVWNGRMPAGMEQYGPEQNVWDHPTIQSIFNGLREYRATGTPPGGEIEMPLPDRGRVMTFLNWLHNFYRAPEGLQRPDGLWIADHPDFEGISTWAFDVYLQQVTKGKSDAEATAEVKRQIEGSDEWRQKH